MLIYNPSTEWLLIYNRTTDRLLINNPTTYWLLICNPSTDWLQIYNLLKTWNLSFDSALSNHICGEAWNSFQIKIKQTLILKNSSFYLKGECPWNFKCVAFRKSLVRLTTVLLKSWKTSSDFYLEKPQL